MQHNPDLAASLLAEVRADGAKTARDLDEGLPRKKEHWGWNWSETKLALEYLFLAGELAVARRNGQFERVYDLPERVLPAAVLDAPGARRRGRRSRAGPPGRPLPRRRARPRSWPTTTAWA